jgi:6-phosphofructokinase 1
MNMPHPQDFAVRQLGEAVFDTPLKKLAPSHFAPIRFTTDDQRVPYDVDLRDGFEFRPDLSFERGGPRERLYFDPSNVRAAIVTCGGLCPGINNVIRSIVMQLRHGYGCPEVFGIHYGYRGIQPSAQPQPSVLNPDMVSEIHKQGGTFLGSSRGPVDPKVMVDFLRSKRIKILFTIGGDGTQRGALDLANTAYDQGYELASSECPKRSTMIFPTSSEHSGTSRLSRRP